MKKILLLLCFLALGFTRANASVISDAAAALAVGNWVKVSPQPTNLEVFQSPEGGDNTILSFSSQLIYNPTTQAIYYEGGDQNGVPLNQFVRLSFATNAVVDLTCPGAPASNCWSPTAPTGDDHSYHYQAIDTTNQKYYVATDQVPQQNRVYDIATGLFGTNLALSTRTWSRAHYAQVYFPGMGLIRVGNSSGGQATIELIAEPITPATAWQNVHVNDAPLTDWSAVLGCSDGQHVVAMYSARNDVIIFGGGNDGSGNRCKRFFKMNRFWEVTRLDDFPVGSGISIGGKSSVTLDPVSGKFLVMDSETGGAAVFYSLDPMAGSGSQWVSLPTTGTFASFMANPAQSAQIPYLKACSPVRDLGVVLCIKSTSQIDGGGGNIHELWLYKHTAQPGGSCAGETGLVGHNDVVFCEPFESASGLTSWWKKGWLNDANKTIGWDYSKLANAPGDNSATRRASIVSTGCVSGSCLKVDMLGDGITPDPSSIGTHWPTKAAGFHPHEMYSRYYLKLATDFTPCERYISGECDYSGSGGGKFPGPADVRTPTEPIGQCGNGGATADGINCWSMRQSFYPCATGSSTTCIPMPPAPPGDAITRTGSYLYFYRQNAGNGTPTGHSGYWDNNPGFPGFSGDGGTCATTPNNTICGIGHGGNLARDVWYRIEQYVKMNDVGVANGIVRGWIDGVLSYEKTNMIFRIAGHDDLHVRTFWLDVYKGGIIGNPYNSAVYIDQLVLTAAESPPATTPAPASPVAIKVTRQ